MTDSGRRRQLAEAGREIGRDLLTTSVVAAVIVGCIVVGGVIGAQFNNDVAPLVGGAIGLVIGIPAAWLIGARVARPHRRSE
jgi:uncharacterized membrane protein